MKKSFAHFFCMGMMGLLLALVCSNCAFINNLINRNQDYYVHQVKWEGETLSIVAKWYTGSLNNWKAITKVNPALDPNRMVIGDDIRIPESLLTTRDPMPKSFLAGFDLEKKIKLSAPQTEPDKKGLPPEIIPPSEILDQQVPPAVIPRGEPVIKPVPADMGEKPVLPEKISLPSTPSTAPPSKRGIKQSPSETARPPELSDKPLPPAPSSPPKAEQKPTQPKAELPPEKEEPPLFGPKGYSN